MVFRLQVNSKRNSVQNNSFLGSCRLCPTSCAVRVRSRSQISTWVPSGEIFLSISRVRELRNSHAKQCAGLPGPGTIYTDAVSLVLRLGSFGCEDCVIPDWTTTLLESPRTLMSRMYLLKILLSHDPTRMPTRLYFLKTLKCFCVCKSHL